MNVIMPQLGETVAEGTIGTWFKQLGDSIQEGDALFEIETDKVTMEVQALASGVLAEVMVAAGATAPVGAVVAVIGSDKVVSSAAEQPREFAQTSVTTASATSDHNANPIVLDPYFEVRTPQRIETPKQISGMRISPLARRLLVQAGIDPSEVAAEAARSGRNKIRRDHVLEAIRRRDVAAVESPELKPVVPESARVPAVESASDDYDLVQLNRMRRKAGENLARAWREIPHVTQAVEVNFQRVERVRVSAHAERQARDVKLTFLPFIARAVCLAIRDYPQVNASLDDGQLRVHRRVNLGIAVDLDHEGLVVPVIKGADDLTVSGLARAINRAVGLARSGKLSVPDLSGATYSISNSGTFGTLFTTPIVNPPQVAILSTDGVGKRAVVIEDPDGDRLGIGRIGVLAQSFDHRAFDGAYSAAFLRRLRQILETRDWVSEL